MLLDTSSDNDLCELAKSLLNSAHRGKLAYRALSFFFATALVVAALYALIAFRDEEEARGFLALVASAGSLGTTGVLGYLAKAASDDEKVMFARVERCCKRDS
ncbi:hypothetical protein [Modestobacter excelsi]|uniref:hypothetical protein n=1 Tax=Modestobacter excelsi TaxID=2213161 RepID=UPI00110D026D|nr:hypothetical protein [Modestobacter excelsi]